MVKSSAGRDDAGNRSGQRAEQPNELDRDQFWINLEAFATSQRGLGLATDRFWGLSWREYEAHRFLWAQERANHYNASFDTKGIPYTPEDFLGTGNREARQAEATVSKVNAEMANIQLQQAVKPGTSDGIPDWAKGEYHAK